jgi:RNA ligase (TIGR02306 family)
MPLKKFTKKLTKLLAAFLCLILSTSLIIKTQAKQAMIWGCAFANDTIDISTCASKSQVIVTPWVMTQYSDWNSKSINLYNEDIDTQLNIQKYEPILLSDGNDLGSFHGLVPKTDEERIQNLTKKYENWKDIDMVATEKLDGTSCTIVYQLDLKRLFSRNLEKKVDVGHKYDIATQNILFPNNYAVQGEIIGKGIQGNSYKQGGFHFYAFNVYDICESKYLQDLETKEFCKEHNIKMVPEIWKGKLSEFESVNDLLLFADGKSVLCNTANREGLAFRSTTFEKNNRISFKVISNKYLLKSKD